VQENAPRQSSNDSNKKGVRIVAVSKSDPGKEEGNRAEKTTGGRRGKKVRREVMPGSSTYAERWAQTRFDPRECETGKGEGEFRVCLQLNIGKGKPGSGAAGA